MQGTLGSFGDLIAFVIPGLVLLVGFIPLSPTVRSWFARPERESAALGGALLLLVWALGAGIMLDAMRVQTVDRIHHLTGVEEVQWSLAQFDQTTFAEFEGTIENYFRFHQFYGNVFVALVFGYLIRIVTLKRKWWPPGWVDAGVVALMCLAWVGSRTELQSCYAALAELVVTN